jgi:hypothetical protein
MQNRKLTGLCPGNAVLPLLADSRNKIAEQERPEVPASSTDGLGVVVKY